ncbi:MAG: hypothetical protein JG777_1543 [Clostridia bacterium]|jgi:hypothetical protein|nr:hypothetical protein [Clostridia bacterium]
MIIDIHAHCFPDELAAKAIPFLEQKSGVTAYRDGATWGGFVCRMRFSCD